MLVKAQMGPVSNMIEFSTQDTVASLIYIYYKVMLRGYTQQKQFVNLTNFLVTSDSIQTTLFICDASLELR